MDFEEIPKDKLPKDWETWSEKEKQAFKEWLPKVNSGGLYGSPAEESTGDQWTVVVLGLLLGFIGLMFFAGYIWVLATK